MKPSRKIAGVPTLPIPSLRKVLIISSFCFFGFDHLLITKQDLMMLFFQMGITTRELLLMPQSFILVHCQGWLTLNACFHLQPGAMGIPKLQRQCLAHSLASQAMQMEPTPENLPKGTSSLTGWAPLSVGSHPKLKNQSQSQSQKNA